MNSLKSRRRMIVKVATTFLMLLAGAELVADETKTSLAKDAEGSIVLSGHGGAVIGVAVHPDGRHVLSASDDGTVRGWDVSTGEEVLKASVSKPGGFFCVAVSPDGKLFAAGSTVGEINVYEFPSGKVAHQFDGKGKQIQGLAFGVDSQSLFSGSIDKSLMWWDWKPGRAPQNLPAHRQAIAAVAATPNGKEVLCAGGDGIVRVISLETGQPRVEWRGPRSPVYGLAISPDGNLFALACDDKSVRVRHSLGRQNDRETHILQGHTDKVMGVAFLADGNYLVSGGFDKKLILWDLKTKRLVKEWAAHVNSQFGVRSVAVHPKGTFIATGGYDAKVRIWKPELPTPAPGTEPAAASGVYAGGMSVSPFEIKDPPDYLANAVRLVPEKTEPKPGSSDEYKIHFEDSGALFLAVKQLAPQTRPNWWGLQLERAYLNQGWIPIENSPWNAAARFWIKPSLGFQTIVISLPPGMKSLTMHGEPIAELELLVVGHDRYLDPKFNEEFGWRYVQAMAELRATAMFHARQWKDLESYFEFGRTNHPRFPDGISVLDMLYRNVLFPNTVSAEKFNELVENYEQAYPESAVPRLIKVQNVTNRVWAQRGGGFGDTVTAEAAEAMEEMVDRCMPLLREAAEASPDDARVDRMQLSVAMGRSRLPAEIQQIAEAGLKKDHWDLELLASAGNFLMPRWTGDATAFSHLARSVRKEYAASSGPSLYAAAALTMFSMEPDEWDTKRGFDYQEMLDGLAELCRRFPENTDYICRAVRAAVHKGDIETARKLFDSLENRHSLNFWEAHGNLLEWHDFFHPPEQSAIRWQRALVQPGGNAMQFDVGGKLLRLATPGGKLYDLDAGTGRVIRATPLGLMNPIGVGSTGGASATVLSTRGVQHFKHGKMEAFRPITPSRYVNAGVLSRDARVGAGIDKELNGHIINGQTGETLFLLPEVVPQGPGLIMEVEISSDGRRLAFSGRDMQVPVYDSASGKLIRMLDHEQCLVTAVAFHSNGKRLVAAGRKPRGKQTGRLAIADPVLWEWNVDTGEVLWTVASPSIHVSELAVSPEGERIALALGSNSEFPYETKLWITRRNQAVDESDFIREQRHKIAEMQSSPDGKHLAVLGRGGFLRIYRFETPQP